MPRLDALLKLNRCPHCSIAKPLINEKHGCDTTNHKGENHRAWKMYICSNCGGVIIATARYAGEEITAFYPSAEDVDETIPSPARDYLEQALESLDAPAGAVMLAASAVDAMLKNKGYKEDGLYTRINKAVEDHLITADMAKWAHEVRLDANEPRHADEEAPLPDDLSAKKAIHFAQALAQFLFVLPGMVERGLEESVQVGEED